MSQSSIGTRLPLNCMIHGMLIVLLVMLVSTPSLFLCKMVASTASLRALAAHAGPDIEAELRGGLFSEQVVVAKRSGD